MSRALIKARECASYINWCGKMRQLRVWETRAPGRLKCAFEITHSRVKNLHGGCIQRGLESIRLCLHGTLAFVYNIQD